MTVLPLRYEGNGMFRCTRPALIDMGQGEVAGFTKAEHRSKKSHDQFFAIVAEAWANLPEGEDELDRFPSAEHLRKFALCKAGYCDRRDIACANNGQAVELVKLITEADDYAIVTMTDRVVSVWRAHSQSVKSMGRETFQKSKEAVLQVLSELLGTDAATLGKAA